MMQVADALFRRISSAAQSCNFRDNRTNVDLTKSIPGKYRMERRESPDKCAAKHIINARLHFYLKGLCMIFRVK